MKTNDGKKGGILKGQKHSECSEKGCGIKAIVTDINKPVELETEEGILSRKTMNSNKTYEFEGKKATPKEIASHLNVEHGGNAMFEKGGEVLKNGGDISDTSTTIQSILFPADKWSIKKAKNWLSSHSYKAKVDKTENYYRFRQIEPERFLKDAFGKDEKFRTIELGSDIKAVVGKLKKNVLAKGGSVGCGCSMAKGGKIDFSKLSQLYLTGKDTVEVVNHNGKIYNIIYIIDEAYTPNALSRIMIANDNNKFIGVLQFKGIKNFGGKKYLLITGIDIEEDNRRQNLATLLYQKAISKSKELGYDGLYSELVINEHIYKIAEKLNATSNSDFIVWSNEEIFKDGGKIKEDKYIKVYHGSLNKINKFDRDRIWVTTEPEEANSAILMQDNFSTEGEFGHLYETEINLKDVVFVDEFEEIDSAFALNNYEGEIFNSKEHDSVYLIRDSSKYDFKEILDTNNLFMEQGGQIPNPKDSINFDIPLLIRMFEVMREDVKTDAELHKIVERLLELKDKEVLTMEDYDFITKAQEKYKNMENIQDQKMKTGGKVQKTKREIYISELENLTNIKRDAISQFVLDNNISDDELLNITEGLGRNLIPKSDFVTAISGSKNNDYAKKIIHYSKTKNYFKMKEGGKIESENSEIFEFKGFKVGENVGTALNDNIYEIISFKDTNKPLQEKAIIKPIKMFIGGKEVSVFGDNKEVNIEDLDKITTENAKPKFERCLQAINEFKQRNPDKLVFEVGTKIGLGEYDMTITEINKDGVYFDAVIGVLNDAKQMRFHFFEIYEMFASPRKAFVVQTYNNETDRAIFNEMLNAVQLCSTVDYYVLQNLQLSEEYENKIKELAERLQKEKELILHDSNHKNIQLESELNKKLSDYKQKRIDRIKKQKAKHYSNLELDKKAKAEAMETLEQLEAIEILEKLVINTKNKKEKQQYIEALNKLKIEAIVKEAVESKFKVGQKVIYNGEEYNVVKVDKLIHISKLTPEVWEKEVTKDDIALLPEVAEKELTVI